MWRGATGRSLPRIGAAGGAAAGAARLHGSGGVRGPGSLPLTSNGKVDRKALPTPDLQSSNPDEFVASNTQMETALASIWRQALGVDCIGLHDNFFELGGHSLLAVRVIGEINRTMKSHLNVPVFFSNPTIKGLVRVLEENHHVAPGPQLVPLQPGHGGAPLYIIGAAPGVVRTVQLMGSDRAVFAIDVPMPEEWRRPIPAVGAAMLPTIEQLGALCGELLRAHAGSTPCVVAGYSFGGNIAFEAVRALQRAGGNVAFVLLLDAHASIWGGVTPGTAWRSLLWIWRGVRTGTASDTSHVNRLSDAARYSWRLLRWLLARMPRAMKSSGKRLTSYFDKEGIPIDNLVLNRSVRMVGSLYRPRSLDASGVLFVRGFPARKCCPATISPMDGAACSSEASLSSTLREIMPRWWRTKTPRHWRSRSNQRSTDGTWAKRRQAPIEGRTSSKCGVEMPSVKENA